MWGCKYLTPRPIVESSVIIETIPTIARVYYLKNYSRQKCTLKSQYLEGATIVGDFVEGGVGDKGNGVGAVYYVQVIFQSVSLYESESCVVTGVMLKVLEVFHHQIARSMTGMTAHSMTSEEW